jgi:hypothetical protein
MARDECRGAECDFGVSTDVRENQQYIDTFGVKNREQRGESRAPAAAGNCDAYRHRILELKAGVTKALGAYQTLADLLDDVDAKTRVNFCATDANAYSQVATIEFANSWSAWLGMAISWIDITDDLFEIPYGTAASYTLGGFQSALREWESHQAPFDEALAEYQKIRQQRAEVLGNLRNLLEQYYCRGIFKFDAEMYRLYHEEIPNSNACDAAQKTALQGEITRDRPEGLGPFWLPANYEAAVNACGNPQ